MRPAIRNAIAASFCAWIWPVSTTVSPPGARVAITVRTGRGVGNLGFFLLLAGGKERRQQQKRRKSPDPEFRVGPIRHYDHSFIPTC